LVFATETDALRKEDVIQCIEVVLTELRISPRGRLIQLSRGNGYRSRVAEIFGGFNRRPIRLEYAGQFISEGVRTWAN
jgi:hypothetical protein